MELTERQIDILEFIEIYQREEGWSPTIREIADAIGVASTSTVYGHLKSLEKKGYITRMDNSPRAIKVLKSYDRVSEMLMFITGGMQSGRCESLC